MMNWLKHLVPHRQPAGRVHRPTDTRIVRARFDAAVTNDENRRHWANADGLSPNAVINAEVRRTLRNRARYESANNSYAKGIVLTLANDVVGTGPRLPMLTDGWHSRRVLVHDCDSLRVYAISRPDLIAMKIIAGRDQDIADLQALRLRPDDVRFVQRYLAALPAKGTDPAQIDAACDLLAALQIHED